MSQPSLFNHVYNTLRVNEAWRFTDDLTAYTQWALDTTKTVGQVVPMIFNNTYQNFYLNLQQIPGNIGAYPFIRYIDITNQKNPLYRDASPTSASTNSTLTFPVGTSTQQTNITNLDRAKQLLFNTIPANVTVTDVQIGPFGGSTFVDLFPANITAGGTAIDLESYMGTTYGDSVGLIGNGFTLKITANNTSGLSQGVNVTLYGESLTYQNNTWLIDYQDAHNQLHRVGTFDDSQIGKTFLLDRLITVPITDPTTPNFGTLLFTLLNSSHPFYTLETYNIVVSLAIVYLLPETF